MKLVQADNASFGLSANEYILVFGYFDFGFFFIRWLLLLLRFYVGNKPIIIQIREKVLNASNSSNNQVVESGEYIRHCLLQVIAFEY